MTQVESFTGHGQEYEPRSDIYAVSLEDYVPNSGNTNSTLYPEHPLHVTGHGMEYRFPADTEAAYLAEAAAPDVAGKNARADETQPFRSPEELDQYAREIRDREGISLDEARARAVDEAARREGGHAKTYLHNNRPTGKPAKSQKKIALERACGERPMASEEGRQRRQAREAVEEEAERAERAVFEASREAQGTSDAHIPAEESSHEQSIPNREPVHFASMEVDVNQFSGQEQLQDPDPDHEQPADHEDSISSQEQHADPKVYGWLEVPSPGKPEPIPTRELVPFASGEFDLEEIRSKDTGVAEPETGTPDLFTLSPEELATDADDAETEESTKAEMEKQIKFIDGFRERANRALSSTRGYAGTVLTSSQRYVNEFKDTIRIATAVPGETRGERSQKWGMEVALGALSLEGVAEGHSEISDDTPDTWHERILASRLGRAVGTLAATGVLFNTVPTAAHGEEEPAFEQAPAIVQAAEAAETNEFAERVVREQITETQYLSHMRTHATGTRRGGIEQNQTERQENQRGAEEQESDLLFVFPVDVSRAEIKEGSATATKEGVWSEAWCRGSSENCHHNYYAADIFAEPGSPVVATIDGEVVSATEENGDVNENSIGSRVEVRGSDGLIHYYAHLGYDSLSITEGETIEAGTKLGTVGDSDQAVDTPPHLHYDVSEGRERINCAGHACSHRGRFANVQPHLQRSYKQQPATP